MNFLSVAKDIVGFAEEAFPEVFADISADEKKQLAEITERCLGFGTQFPFSGAVDRLALKVAVMREFSIFRKMLLDRMIAERRHNAERVFMFIGKSVTVVVAAIPLAVVAVGSVAQGVAE